MPSIDLREYFPSTTTTRYLTTPSGQLNTRYTFTESPPGFQSLYTNYLNINKPGYWYTWQKEYMKAGSWCCATYGVLFMGDDGSVTEVGDWMSASGCAPNVAFGYKTSANGTNTGLIWSPPGGLSETPVVAEMCCISQVSPGAAFEYHGYDCFSRVGLIEHLDTYTPPFGRSSAGVWGAGNGRTYTDVVHLVMYHGTRGPTPSTIRCVAPLVANGAYYQSYKNYNSYAMELYLVRGIGIIHEDTPFVEDGSFWGVSNCNGSLFVSPGAWAKYIDYPVP